MRTLVPTLRKIERSAAGLILVDWISHDDARLADLVDTVLTTHTDAAMSASLQVYELDRESSGVSRPYRAQMPDPQPIKADGLVGWARSTAVTDESFKKILISGAQKRIAAASRRAIIENAAADPAARGWQRRARPGACYFCRMLAGRAELYRSQDTSSFASHNDCFCEAVPAWGGRALPVKKFTPSKRESSEADRARVRKWIADNRDELADA